MSGGGERGTGQESELLLKIQILQGGTLEIDNGDWKLKVTARRQQSLGKGNGARLAFGSAHRPAKDSADHLHLPNFSALICKMGLTETSQDWRVREMTHLRGLVQHLVQNSPQPSRSALGDGSGKVDSSSRGRGV